MLRGVKIMPRCRKSSMDYTATLIVTVIGMCLGTANSLAAGIQNTTLACEKLDDMHLVTALAAANDQEGLKAAETRLIASGNCITLKKGNQVELITSVRAHAPGTNLFYSLAKVKVANRQVYVYRQNLAP